MASSLKTLIKVAKSEVDRQQKELAEVQTRQDYLKNRIQKLENEVANEKAIAEKNYESPELAASFSSFAKAAQGKIEQLEVEAGKLEEEIIKLREALSEAFAEQKKFEIVEATNLKRAREEAARTEASKLDEVGTNMFMRNENSE